MTDPTPNRPGINALVTRIWLQKKDVTLSRVATIEQACAALSSAALAPELRGEAAIESHKLAGSLGTFGFPEGSRLACRMQEILTSETALNRDDAEELTRLLRELRRELEKPPQQPPPSKKKDTPRE